MCTGVINTPHKSSLINPLKSAVINIPHNSAMIDTGLQVPFDPKVGHFIDPNFFNKRPMGHIAHMRSQFKSMNTFELINDYKY